MWYAWLTEGGEIDRWEGESAQIIIFCPTPTPLKKIPYHMIFKKIIKNDILVTLGSKKNQNAEKIVLGEFGSRPPPNTPFRTALPPPPEKPSTY